MREEWSSVSLRAIWLIDTKQDEAGSGIMCKVVFRKVYRTVEKRCRSSNPPLPDPTMLQSAVAKYLSKNSCTGCLELENGGTLHPWVMVEIGSTTGRTSFICAVPQSSHDQSPCVAGTLEFLQDVRRVMRHPSQFRGNAGSLERLAWFLSAAAPFGTPVESNELVLELSSSRANRTSYAMQPSIRHPSWKPYPSRDKEVNGKVELFFSSQEQLRVSLSSRVREVGTILHGETLAGIFPGPSTVEVKLGGKMSLGLVMLEELCCHVTDAEAALDERFGWEIHGSIECASRIESIAEVTLTLQGIDNILELNMERDEDSQIDVRFFYHPCVRTSGIGAPPGGRVIFTPPLGTFMLCNYRIHVPWKDRLGSGLHSIPKNVQVLDNVTVTTASSLLSSALSVEDRGRFEALQFRRGASFTSTPPKPLPNLPISGCFHVDRCFEGKALDLELEIHSQVEMMSNKNPSLVAVHLTLLGAARYLDYGMLRHSAGEICQSGNDSTIIWTFSAQELTRLGAVKLSGRVLTSIDPSCASWSPSSQGVHYDGRVQNQPLTTPLREDPMIVATVWTSFPGRSASGLGIDPLKIQVSPHLKSFGSKQADMARHVFLHSALVLNRCEIKPTERLKETDGCV